MIEVWNNQRNCKGQCAECPGTEAAYPIGGIGSLQSDIMVVANEPAPTEDDFSDWAKLHRKIKSEHAQEMSPLWKHLSNIGVAAGCKPEELYFTYLAKCNTDSTWESRYENCSGYFIQELYKVSPDLILAHGKQVVESLLSVFELEWSGDMVDVHGQVFEHEIADIGCLYDYEDEDQDTVYEMVK